MTNEKTHQVLLYYFYNEIKNPEQLAIEHLQFCNDLQLKGRVLIAEEGINGTVSGTIEQTNKYMNTMHNDPLFKDTEFKIDLHDGHAFEKMHVRHREELVTLRLEEELDPREITGNFLSPRDFYKAMQDDNTIVLDARNDYEYDVGHFRGAIRPEISTFRELPNWIKKNRDKLDGKKILTYCTGGIRCEKFSGWLVQEGYDNVSQLQGGIIRYGKDPEVQGELWDGQCYVFDKRITVPINQTEHVVVGVDYFDGQPCERYINCAEPDCNRQFLCSEENEHKYLRACSHKCRVDPRNRYVIEHKLTQAQVDERLALIERDIGVQEKV